MASKKKAKAKAKTKAKTKAKPKTKLKAKAKSATPKKKTKSKKPTPKKRKAKPATPLAAAPRSEPVLLDEIIEEPLVDVSGILRVKDEVARSRRDADEDDLKLFPDPSLVIEAQRPARTDDTDENETRLPELFAAEARREAARKKERGES